MTELIKQLSDYIKQIEKRNKTLETALSDLLAEEDIMNCPGYNLLKLTYSKFITDVVEDATDTTVYDPIYMPPKIRRKNKVKPPTYTKASKEPKPDIFDTWMGGDFDPPGNATKTTTATKDEPQYNEIHTGKSKIFEIEIKGITYYYFNNYIYDKENCVRIGQITENGFRINDKLIKFSEKSKVLDPDPIDSDYPDIYMDQDKTGVYKFIDTNIIQKVGEVNDGEILLYQWEIDNS
jgi:hypothetical protein